MNIEILQGNIIEQDVDAIVNAAHEALMSGGGVDGAIHRAAGPGLIRECQKFPAVKGVRCPVGEAKITAGCKLKAKYVIHTVAPKFIGSCKTGLMGMLYNNATEGTDEDLEKCYTNCLKVASETGLKSIAFPSLGTGGHAYPIELACPIALKAIDNFFSKPSSIETVKLILFSKSDYDFYVKTASE